MTYEREDGAWMAWVFWSLILIVGALLLFGVISTNLTPSAKPNWHKAHCYKIPAKYHGGLYCSREGLHGYVNPGSMEWEVE